MFPNKDIIKKLREEYPPGCFVELVSMDDVQAPPIGTRGIVQGVDDAGSIMVAWENGSSLSVAYGADFCKKSPPIKNKKYKVITTESKWKDGQGWSYENNVIAEEIIEAKNLNDVNEDDEYPTAWSIEYSELEEGEDVCYEAKYYDLNDPDENCLKTVSIWQSTINEEKFLEGVKMENFTFKVGNDDCVHAYKSGVELLSFDKKDFGTIISHNMSVCYNTLYNNHNRPEIYELIINEMDKFDVYAKENKDIVGIVTKARGDYISSDRECAAFMLALELLDTQPLTDDDLKIAMLQKANITIAKANEIVIDDKIHSIFHRLVPPKGPAQSIAGEITRAINRIDYRYYNDGDKVGIGYGRETCNPAAKYLYYNTNTTIASLIAETFEEANERDYISDTSYERWLLELKQECISYLEKNPQLEKAENKSDMLSYFNKNEDYDYTWDEEYIEDGVYPETTLPENPVILLRKEEEKEIEAEQEISLSM